MFAIVLSMLSVLSAAIRSPCLQFSFPRHLVCTLCQQPKHTQRNTQRWGAYQLISHGDFASPAEGHGAEWSRFLFSGGDGNHAQCSVANQVDQKGHVDVGVFDVLWIQNAGVIVKPRSAPLLKEYRLSVWAALKAGGVFGADGLAGRPMAPSRLQVDVSESTNSVVAPIACPQAGCLWVGPMAMLQKTCTLGMFGSRLALPLVVATWQKVAVSAWWPKWHPENGFHCLFNLRLHSLQLSFHLGVILGKLGNLLGDFTKDPNTWNFFQQVWFSGGRILYEILRLPPLESYFHVKRCLWRSRQLT